MLILLYTSKLFATFKLDSTSQLFVYLVTFKLDSGPSSSLRIASKLLTAFKLDSDSSSSSPALGAYASPSTSS